MKFIYLSLVDQREVQAKSLVFFIFGFWNHKPNDYKQLAGRSGEFNIKRFRNILLKASPGASLERIKSPNL